MVYRMPELKIGGEAELETDNIRSMQTMLGREAKERGWEITTRASENGIRINRIR